MLLKFKKASVESGIVREELDAHDRARLIIFFEQECITLQEGVSEYSKEYFNETKKVNYNSQDVKTFVSKIENNYNIKIKLVDKF